MKNKLITAALLTGAAMASQGALAAPDGTISISGRIVAQTCTTTPITVNLPHLPTSAFQSSSTAGDTTFDVQLSNCQVESTIKVYPQFSAGANTTFDADGRMHTSGTGQATGVQLELRNSDNSQVMLNAANQASTTVAMASASPKLSYLARYYVANTASLVAGSVDAALTYTIVYQ